MRLLAICILMTAVVFSSMGNMLQNSGFEEILNIGLESSSVPGWEIAGKKAGVVQQDCAMGLFGVKSLKVQYHQLPESGDWMIYQDAKADPGKEYRFSGWLNSYKGSGAFRIALMKNGVAIREFSLDAWNGEGVYGNVKGAWQYKTLDFDSGNADTIRIACVLKNEKRFLDDTVWFDGLELIDRKVVAVSGKTDDTESFPKELHVDALAHVGGDGTASRPFRSIQDALDKAGAGTTILVKPGTYYGALRFVRGGKAGAPLVLKGMPGASLEGRAAIKLSWNAVPEWGKGVYASGELPGLVRGVYALPKGVGPALKLPLVRYERAGDQARKADDPYHYRNIFRDGIVSPEKSPGQGFDVLRAVAMYNPEDHRVYVRFGDNSDPNTMSFVLADGSALVDIDGVEHVTVEGFQLANSVKGVVVRRSSDVTISDCEFRTIEYGIQISFSERVMALNNVLSLNAIHESNPHAQVISTSSGLRYQPDVWRAFKWVGYYDRCGIIVSESKDCEVTGNYIHDHWDGIAAYGKSCPGLKVRGNHVTNITDDGFTIHGDVGQEWSGNVVMNSYANIRYWDNRHNRGPVFIYGNRLIHGRQDQIRFMEDTETEIYVYHNTMVGGEAIRYHGQKAGGIGTPNLYVYNNRFLGGFFGMTSRVGKGGVVPNFKSGYNTYLEDRHNVIGRYGMNAHGSRGAGHVGRGVDLPAFLGRSLPGCAPGYYQGKSPDCGTIGQ